MKFTLLVRYICLLILFFCLTWQVNAAPADDFIIKLESSNSSSATATTQLPLASAESPPARVTSGSTPPRVTSDPIPAKSYQNQSGAIENFPEKTSTNQSSQQDDNEKKEEADNATSTNLFQDATYENFLPQKDSNCFDKNHLERET